MITLPNPYNPKPGHNQPPPPKGDKTDAPNAQKDRKGLIIGISVVAFIAVLVLIGSIALAMKLSVNTQKLPQPDRSALPSSEHTDPVPNPVPGESPGSEDADNTPTSQKPNPDSKKFPLKYKITVKGNPADISYTDKNSEVKTIKDVSGNWSMTVPFKDESQQDTAVVSVSQYGYGTVSCKIIKGGEIVSEHELEGPYPSVSCKQKQEPVYPGQQENSEDS